MEAVNKGDLNAFEQLVRRHQSWVWKIAYRFLGNSDEASDITQDAFLRLLDASRHYRVTAKFRTYFYRIITRLCIDHARKNRAVPIDSLPDIPAPGPSQIDRLEHQELESGIQKALDALPPEYRMVIILRYFEGLSGVEIANAVKKTPKGVERLLARARKNLELSLYPYSQKITDDYEGESDDSPV